MPTIAELCDREPIVASRSDTLQEAALRMHQHHVGCLVVVDDSDERHVVGVLTDRDIVVRAVAEGTSAASAICDIITQPAVTCSVSDSWVVVLGRMKEAGVRRVPVLDAEGKLVGLLAFEEVLAQIHGELGELVALSLNERRHETVSSPRNDNA